jgi:hypothetical protein
MSQNIKIQEKIHHGDYINVRVVEVYAINEITVDAILQSSAYGYGSYQTDRLQKRLDDLVTDLKAGEKGYVGWSTFEVIK